MTDLSYTLSWAPVKSRASWRLIQAALRGPSTKVTERLSALRPVTPATAGESATTGGFAAFHQRWGLQGSTLAEAAEKS